MPSNYMHLYAGNIFTERIKIIKNKSLFFLGCLAPDRVNIDGFAEKDMRTNSHRRDKDLSVWQNNLKEYLHYSSLPIDFKLGICFHCITDIVWDDLYDDKFYNQIRAKGVPESMLKDQRWAEMYSFDKTQVDEIWLKEGVIPDLKDADCSIFGDEFHQLNRFRNYVINDYKNDIVLSEYMMIDKQFVDELSLDAVKRMAFIIQSE